MYKTTNVNKGLAIRNKKLNKKIEKRNTITKDQEYLCKFVKVKNPKTGYKNHKRTFEGVEIIYGLQVQKKVFYTKNGELHYIARNKKGCIVLKSYKPLPDWASPELISLYNKKKEEFSCTQSNDKSTSPDIS